MSDENDLLKALSSRMTAIMSDVDMRQLIEQHGVESLVTSLTYWYVEFLGNLLYPNDRPEAEKVSDELANAILVTLKE